MNIILSLFTYENSSFSWKSGTFFDPLLPLSLLSPLFPLSSQVEETKKKRILLKKRKGMKFQKIMTLTPRFYLFVVLFRVFLFFILFLILFLLECEVFDVYWLFKIPHLHQKAVYYSHLRRSHLNHPTPHRSLAPVSAFFLPFLWQSCPFSSSHTSLHSSSEIANSKTEIVFLHWFPIFRGSVRALFSSDTLLYTA